MGEKHSAVGYLFREGAFLPAQETKPVRNEFGLDLFQHRGSVYEGKTGLQFCSLKQAEDLAGFVEKHGGSGFLGFHGILHESYVIVAIGIIGLILLITDFIRIKKNNR